MRDDRPPQPVQMNSQQLQQQLAQIQGVCAQRGMVFVSELVDGLVYLKQAALAGDPGARQQCRLLAEQIKSLEAAANGISVVGIAGNGHTP